MQIKIKRGAPREISYMILSRCSFFVLKKIINLNITYFGNNVFKLCLKFEKSVKIRVESIIYVIIHKTKPDL